jgi:hypothetical protein
MPFAWLLLAAAAPADAVDVSLDQLRARPAEFAGRTVRVTGQMDQCWNMSCLICPLESTPARPQWERCIEIAFDRLTGGEGNRGIHMDAAFRYADVVVTARFDPACFDLCLDRATVLFDARVEQVTRRRRSRDGLLRRDARLLPVPEEVAVPLIAMFTPSQSNDPVRVFTTPSDPNMEQRAIVCRSRVYHDEPASWPVDWLTALVARSTEDNYECWTVRRVGSSWALD